MAVSRAVKRGRLTAACVVRNDKGKPVGISDPKVADKEWDANTDYTDAPHAIAAAASARIAAPAPAPEQEEDEETRALTTMSEASLAEKIWKARHAELKFREAAAELVPAADVSAKLVNVFTQCKTRLLGVPSRARQALPHLSVADVGVLETIVREALEDLGKAGQG